MQRIVRDHPQAAVSFAELFHDQGRTDDALALCEALLDADPSHQEAALLSARLLADSGETEKGLRRLLDMERRGMTSDAMWAEVTRQILTAAHIYETLRSQGDIEKALKICDALVDLRPGRSSLLLAQSELRDMEGRRHTENGYQSRRALIAAYQQEGDLEAELEQRLILARHPLELSRRNVDRVDNLFYALSRLLGADLDEVGGERVARARSLLTEIERIPIHSLAEATTEDEIYAARFDRWYRLLLSTIDLDMVFGPPLPPSPPLPTPFALADGTPADIAGIGRIVRAQDAKVAFYAATSPEYFQRYAEAYVRTMLKSADCNAVVFVLLCCPFERFAEVIADFPIQDPRLFFGCDGYDGHTSPDRVVRATDVELIVGTHHYAASALLRLDHLLDHVGVPVFVTGIDTVLQHGVADLLEKFADRDVVLNKIGSHFGLGGQIVNNLSLTFPTPIGGAFVRFLKAYTGKHLAEVMQPGFLDQLDLHMAKHHVARIEGAKLGFFDEFDINNLMFDNSMVDESRDFIRRYRFINIFATGCEDNAIDPENL